MSVKELLSWESYINYMDKQLEIWAQPCTIFSPERKVNLGYEDTNYSEIDEMNTDVVLGNKYDHTLEDIKTRLFGNPEIIIVDFSKEVSNECD